jgi:hypothetical protein
MRAMQLMLLDVQAGVISGVTVGHWVAPDEAGFLRRGRARAAMKLLALVKRFSDASA